MDKTDSQIVKFTYGNADTQVHSDGEETVGNGNVINDQPCSVALLSTDVTVKVDITTHTSGSSAVVTRNITKYPWDQVYIPGNLVAVHCSENFVAYAIKAPKTNNGMVRIICRRTGLRGLVKNIPGLVKDIAFAYLTTRTLLGFIDQYGTVFVYEIHEDEKEDTLRTDQLVEIKKSDTDEDSDYQRLIWCPYIPDEDEELEETDEDNFAYLLVATNGPVAVIWHIWTMIQEQNCGAVTVDHSKEKSETSRNYVMRQHSAPIVDAAYSPDGTALATASLDGFVKFFQVYLSDEQNPPRCLHEWIPHDGKPLSCLFFLDNHRVPPSPEVQFWKYAVTGACQNTELKVWSCETWMCNQTVRFESTEALRLGSPPQALKASIDPTSNYVTLSDIYRRVLYVAILGQEKCSTSKLGPARIYSLTELPIQFPIVSMTITDADWKPYKRWKHEPLFRGSILDYDEDEANDNVDITEGLVMKSILINTQSLQDTTICFQPALPKVNPIETSSNVPITETSTLQEEDSIIIRDGLTDLSITANLSSSIDLLKQENSSERQENHSPFLLSFPSTITPSAPPHSSSPPLPTSTSSVTSTKMVTSLNIDDVVPSLSSPIMNATNVNEPITMNLLTPESFSSPGRIDEPTSAKKDSNLAELEKMSRKTPSPSEELNNAALSLLIRSGQPSCRRSKTPEIIPNILDSVISGSRVSPTITKLPPPPGKTLSPIPIQEEPPLATSEISTSSTSEVHLSTVDNNRSNVPLVGHACSSTSSPSLEVQQILQQSNYLYKEDGRPVNRKDKAEKQERGGQDDFQQHTLIDLPNPSPKEVVTSTCSSFPSISPPVVSMSSIPSISVSNKNDNKRSLQELMNITSENTDLSKQTSSLMNMLGPMKLFSCSEIEADLGNKVSTTIQNGAMPILEKQSSYSVDYIEFQNVSTKTQKDIESLKEVMYSCNAEHQQRMEVLQDNTTKLMNQFEKSLKINQQMSKHIDELQMNQSKMLDQIPNIVKANIGPLIETIVKQEIRSALNPAFHKCFDPLRTQISAEVRQLISSNESLLSDALTKTLYSKSFIDTLSSSVSSSLSNGVQNACRESYNKIVLPGLNAVTSQVFSQLNEAFTRGTKEYINHVKTESQSTRQTCIDTISKSTKAIEASACSLSANSTILVNSMKTNISMQTSLSDTLGDKMKKLVYDEVARALQEHYVAVEARNQQRTQTPVPFGHTPNNPKLAQQQVQQLISRSQFNLAFKQALSSLDLSLVVFVCERINPQQLFSQTPCPLTQEVLLSLVNQLSYDLTTFTDLKTKYLEESVMNLDTTHPVTLEHMQTVLQDLQANLTKHVKLYPMHKKLKMLLLAVNHLASRV